jgi:pimeloyl-ACP methyl ester carboxylesterase
MSTPAEPRSQQVATDDGVVLVATVHGQGPPVLMLPAGPGDSSTCWQCVRPLLSEGFTCHLLDTRGRGASGDHPDHSPSRLVQDVLTYAATIGEPVGLVGWGAALWARVAAEAPDSVGAVAAYEPGANEVMNEDVAATLEATMPLVGELVEQGRPVEAANAFLEKSSVIYAQDELATGVPSAFWTESARRLAVFLQDEQAEASTRPGPTEPTVLSTISAPVLLLTGTRSRPWFRDSVRYIAEHLPNATVRDIEGAAHFGPHLEARAVADEMARFFAAHLSPGWA